MSLTIPLNITQIGDNCFVNTSELKILVLHDGIEYIGDCCFYSCENTSEVTIIHNSNVLNANAKLGANTLFHC